MGSNVGIGKAPLASSPYSLDVSGNVNVSGTIMAGNVGFRIVTITGTLPTAANSLNIAFPSGVSSQNITMLVGYSKNGASLNWVPFYGFSDISWNVYYYINNGTGCIELDLLSTSTAAAGKDFKICIMYVP